MTIAHVTLRKKLLHAHSFDTCSLCAPPITHHAREMRLQGPPEFQKTNITVTVTTDLTHIPVRQCVINSIILRSIYVLSLFLYSPLIRG